MKKLKLLILFFLLPIVLCSCNKKEYHLIEITGDELVKNLIHEDKNFVFAIVDESEDDAEQFLKDLEGIVKSANINIYYVDYLHISNAAGFELINYYSTDFSTNAFFAFQNHSFVVANEYVDYKTTYSLLKDKAYTDELVRIDEDSKKEAIKEAQKLYKESKISAAHEKLCIAWDLEEAKEEHNNNKYYHLINGWERIEYTNDVPEKVRYTSLIINSGTDYYFLQKESGIAEEFEKPTALLNYEQVYYRLKDNIIYTSNREKGHYEETYQIDDVDSKYLKITDLKKNKKMTYVRRDNL